MGVCMNAKIIFILISFVIQFQAYALEKKNICAMTISSSNEINTFKKLLNPEQFNFIELTMMGDEFTWFDNACRSNTKCDVLIISAHFAGNFFSLENQYLKLSSDEMERKACANTCSGILKSPIETYLFGCNTLAIKNNQSRTREQYRQVLLNDDMPPTLVDQALATLFSPIASAYYSRMRKIFYNTPMIYGFSDKGPSGKNVEGYLKNYLSSIKDYYAHLEKLKPFQGSKLSDSDFAKYSSLWNKAMSNTAKSTATGFGQGAKKECGLFSDDLYLTDKFKIVNELFNDPDVSEYLMPIQSFLNKVDTDFIYQGEKEEFEKIKSNDRVKGIALGIIHAIEDLPSLRISLLKMAFKLGWLDLETYQNDLNKTLTHIFQDGIDYEESQIICDAKITGSIPTDVLMKMPETSWHAVAAMNCLKLNNPTYFQFLKNYVGLRNDQYLAYQTMNLISFTDLSESQALDYIQANKKHSFYLVRYFAARAIGDRNIKSEEGYRLLIEFLNDPVSDVKFAAEVSLQILKPTEPWVMDEIKRISPQIISW